MYDIGRGGCWACQSPALVMGACSVTSRLRQKVIHPTAPWCLLVPTHHPLLPPPTPMAFMASQVEQVKRAQTLTLAHRFQGVNYTSQATYRYSPRFQLSPIGTHTWFWTAYSSPPCGLFSFAVLGVCEDTVAFHSIWTGETLAHRDREEREQVLITHTVCSPSDIVRAGMIHAS